MADSPGARTYPLTLLVGLGGAGLVAVGMSQPWVTATASVDGLPAITASVDGADLAPLAGALGVVLLASFAAVVATRGRVRQVVGVTIIGCSAVVLVAVVTAGQDAEALESGLASYGWAGGPYGVSAEPWRWLVAIGALLCFLAGVAVVRWGAAWATMGSRYDAPSEGPSESTRPDLEPDLWKAIDRGHDPTQDA